MFAIEGVAIKNVSTFKYLGYKISNDSSNNNVDVQFRITLAQNKFQEMKKLLCDRDIPIKLRAKTFLQAFVRSRMCYSVQAWTLKEPDMRLFETKWHGFLRRMINGGFSRKKDSMSFKYSNEDLVRITGTSPIRNYIQKQQLKFLAHVCRMDNKDMRKQVLFTAETKNSHSIWSGWEKVLNIDKKQIWKIMMDRDKFFEFLNKINLY